MSRASRPSGRGEDPGRHRPELETPASDFVHLRVFYKEGIPNAADDVDLRLRRLNEGTGVMAYCTKDLVVLVNMERPITHVEWTHITHWLLTQPEVKFAIRTFPLTVVRDM